MSAPAAAATSTLEQTAHYATLCRCHSDLWGPLCAPYLHGTVPLVLDVDTAKRIVTCVYCRADMTRRGLLDVARERHEKALRRLARWLEGAPLDAD